MQQVQQADGATSPTLLHAPRAQLSMRDEAQLEWFFCRGQIAFERSTFGATLERAELFSVSRLYRPEYRPVLDAEGRVIGSERAISARPTAEIRQAAGYVPDSETLERFAVVSTWLKRVEARSRLYAAVLECLYGDLGQRWAGHELYGRMGSLFHLTAKGRAMVEDSRKKSASTASVSDQDRMEVLCTVQRAQPNTERGQALAYCQAQAEVLAIRAKRCLLIVKAEEGA